MNTLTTIQAKNIRPNMITGDCLVTAVDYIEGKVRIFHGRRYEDYTPNAWLPVSKYDNSGTKILE